MEQATEEKKKLWIEKPITKQDVIFLKKHVFNQIKCQIHLNKDNPKIIFDKDKSEHLIVKYIDPQSFVILSSFTRNNRRYPNKKFYFGKGTIVILEEVGINKVPGFIVNHGKEEIFWPRRVLQDFIRPVSKFDIIKLK